MRSEASMPLLTCRNLTVAVRARALEHAWLFTALCVFGGCALPKGQVSSDQHAVDAGTRDASIEKVDSGKVARGGADGTAAGSGGGGSPSKASDAGVARSSEIPSPAKPEPKPRANGEACASSDECASANCKRGPQGDKRCYGAVARGRACSGEFDCDGYACVPRKRGEKEGVCIDTSACAQDTCQQNHALAYCQLDQKCSASPKDFAQCYLEQCTGDADTDAGCPEESVEQRLNELGCCPPNGVGTGTCATSPQCGCPENQKCDSLRDGRTACGPIGPGPAGAECEQDAQCPSGFTCRGKLCRRYCDGFDDDSCGKGACVSSGPKTQPEPGIFICVEGCDPTAPMTASDDYAACGPNQGCEAAPDGNAACYATRGTGTQGAPCPNEPDGTYIPKCAPGYACLIASDTCAQLCKVQDDHCSVGSCRSFGPSKEYAGSVEIGYCR
jgi:hypothetical protein